MSPKFLIALTAACIAFSPSAMAQSQTGPGASGSPDASRAGGGAAGAIIGGAAGKLQTSTGDQESWPRGRPIIGGAAGKSSGQSGQIGADAERMGGGAGKSK